VFFLVVIVGLHQQELLTILAGSLAIRSTVVALLQLDDPDSLFFFRVVHSKKGCSTSRKGHRKNGLIEPTKLNGKHEVKVYNMVQTCHVIKVSASRN
jgi:hypothetical protein